ncbi:type II toxin-antitoxin system HipA family toxin, partial [Bifidobacterium longum]
SPQYDAVATRYWPEFNWELTMPLNEDHAFAEHTTPQDWEDLATRHGLDGSRVADMARRMAGKVLAGISESCEGLDARMADRLNACWTKANESIEPIMPGDEPANSPDPASALPDSLGFPSSGRTI